MPGPEEITKRLEQAGITYCIVGGLASIAYGRPRLTLDADLVVAINPRQIASLIDIIHQHSALRADCYLPDRSELARWELAHRQRLPLGSGEAWFAPPESVIIHKLIFHREGGSEKHLEDVRGILLATRVDQKIIVEWVAQLGLAEGLSAATRDL